MFSKSRLVTVRSEPAIEPEMETGAGSNSGSGSCAKAGLSSETRHTTHSISQTIRIPRSPVGETDYGASVLWVRTSAWQPAEWTEVPLAGKGDSVLPDRC